MSGTEIQQAIFAAIRQQIMEDRNLADVLAPILNLNKNAVYKRISGTTPLNLEDLARLTRHFQLPIQSIFYENGSSFQADFSGFLAKYSSLEYLSNLEQDLLQAQQATDARVMHVTIGLPDFYYFYFDDLALFQIFTWERMTWDRPEWQGQKFTLDFPDKEKFLSLTRRLAMLYSQLNITEIWNEYVLDNFFQELLYVVESRLFEKKEDIIKLLDLSENLIAHIKDMAQKEKRFPMGSNGQGNSAPFNLYFNETMKNNIFFLVESMEGPLAYAVLDNPNFIKTSDPKIIDHFRQAFEKLLKRAMPLGMSGERYREIYFQKLENRQHYFKTEIERLLKTDDSNKQYL